jgi:hypothetical protein
VAIVWAFRVGVALTPATLRLWRNVQGPQAETYLKVGEELKRRLTDPSESDADLAEALSKQNGYPVLVTTISGDFETRRLQMEFSVTGASLLDEDIRVITFHAIKLSGGAPINTWDSADFQAMTVAIDTWWNAVKVWYHQNFVWTRLAFYRAGPNVVPPQTHVFESLQNSGGLSLGQTLPPQVAVSVTERAGQKKNWGRFYMPAPAVTSSTGVQAMTDSGRPNTAMLTAFADATDALYESQLTANRPFVVYRPLLEAGRPTKDRPQGSELPERPANAQTVDTIQVDDVFDVIRSRRWDNPTLRLQRGVGAAEASSKPGEAAPADAETAPDEQQGEALAGSPSAGV